MDSILRQTLTDFEFIIVDDGSTDGSAAIIEACAKRDRRIRFLQHERNLGTADARNTGMSVAEADYIAFMDCDDISLPGRLEAQVAFLDESPLVGAVGTGFQFVSKDLLPLRTISPPSNRSSIAFNLLNRGESMLFATMMARREYLDASGGFRSEFKRRQDLDLVMRMLRETRIRYSNLPQVLYLYRQHRDSVSPELRNARDKAFETIKT